MPVQSTSTTASLSARSPGGASAPSCPSRSAGEPSLRCEASGEGAGAHRSGVPQGGARPLVRHNPAFLAPDELRRGFAVRRDTLARVVRALSVGDEGAAPRVLITGQRGAGKTTLALRAAQELTVASGGAWILASLGEETFTATTAAELWAELAQAAREGRGGAPGEADGSRDRGEVAGSGPEALAAAAGLAAGGGRSGRVLAVIENLDTLLDRQLKGAEAARWQEEASSSPWLAVLATARRRPETLRAGWDEAPLAPLSLAECRTLWGALAGRVGGAPQRLEGHAVRPVQLFTGGVPRRLVALAEASAPLVRSAEALWEGLLALGDAETPRVTALAESLPPVERKVFVALALRWAPTSARQVGFVTGLGTNRASALLHRLVGRGVVARRDGSAGRSGATYELRDRGDNVVLALRRGGVAARGLRALVDFVAWFYWGAGGLEGAGDDGDASEAAEVLGRAREHGVAGRWREAVEALGMLMGEAHPGRALGGGGLELLLEASARGEEAAVGALCEEAAWAHELAPLRVALALRTGVREEDLTAPAEVRAVALDVLSAILSRREA